MIVPESSLLALLGSRDAKPAHGGNLLDADVHVRGNELTLTGESPTWPSPRGCSPS